MLAQTQRLAQTATFVYSKAMSPVCALCRLNPDLQNSHIIPEFFFRLIYDIKPRRFHLISTEPCERERFAQKGLREPLLCRACEQKLGRWEHYAKAAFLDGKGITFTQLNDRVVLHGIDYKTFKLFQLSLLWRMSASSLPFFKDVDLGPHQETLRQTLLNEDPLQPNHYACWLIAVQMNGDSVVDWIIEPSLARVDGHHIYWLVITGILFSFYVGSHPPPPVVAPLVLNDHNDLTIMIREIKDIPFLADFAMRLSTAIQSRNRSK
jgi:hypothetical protein